MTPDEAERLARLRAACPGWRFSHEQDGGAWHFVAEYGYSYITTLTVSALARTLTELGSLVAWFGERYRIDVVRGKWIAERQGRVMTEGSAADLADAIQSDLAESVCEGARSQAEGGTAAP